MVHQDKGRSRGFLERLLSPFISIWVALFGSFQWTPPPWARSLGKVLAPVWNVPSGKLGKGIDWLGAKRRQEPKKFWMGSALILAVIGASAGGYWYYQSLPKPEAYRFTVNIPRATPLEKDAKPDNLIFSFTGSVARLEDIDKTVSAGAKIVPALKGQWKWRDDKILVFVPEEDWGVHVDYRVTFSKTLFPKHIRLENYQHDFTSASFVTRFASSEFYQDPKNPQLKQVIATLKFSHPVDRETLEKRLKLTLGKANKDGLLGMGSRSFPFKVSYDEFNSEAYIASDPIPIPEEDGLMKITVDSGVRSSRGGNTTPADIHRDVVVPGMTTYFKIDNIELSLVRNERFEPEQVVVISTTGNALQSELEGHLDLYLLPKDRPELPGMKAHKNHQWYATAEVDEKILGMSEKVKWEAIPTETEFAMLHSFRVQLPVGRFLYARVTKGVKAYGGYILAKTTDAVIQIRPFPKELKIMNEGSILSMGGSKKLPLLSRDIEGIEIEISRILPEHVNHLITQSSGTWRNGQNWFENWKFNKDNLTERFVEHRTLGQAAPGKTQYSSVDLGQYLAQGEKSRRGWFFVKVTSWDPVAKETTGTSDYRVILVTDIGLVSKQSKDGSQDIFVQSIRTGLPLSGVAVSILGKNGVPLFSKNTDEQGHVTFPTVKDYKREQEPAVYLARLGGDLSFLPYRWYDRQISYSRFDVGGVVTASESDKLDGFLFSDRGIYRPGDSMNLGIIVKAADWTKPLGGIPVEMSLSDPRGLEVYSKKFSLNADGFHELAYSTRESSPTGTYVARLYIVKDKRRRGMIGHVEVKVEEFLPDRMKISTRLSEERVKGWVSPLGLKGRVNLKNLFGTAAADRTIKAMISLYPSYPTFNQYSDYRFYDPMKAKREYQERLLDATTDANGDAEFLLDLERFEKATYRLVFMAEGFEAEGGRAVTSQSSVLVSPLSSLVGYKTDGDLNYISKDSKRQIEIIAIDRNLEKRTLADLKAHLVERKFVSVLTRQPNGTFKYQSVERENTVSEKPLTIPVGGLKYDLPTDKPGDYSLILKDNDGTELNRIPFSIAGSANLAGNLERNSELKIKLKNPDVSAGDFIEMEIKAPYTGAGLITIERERVLAFKWFKTQSSSSVERIRVPAGMEGNGYVNVTFVRAADSKEIFMSPLSFGVVPFSISREKRVNEITLAVPQLTRPGEDFKISYRGTKKGKVVIFAVDQGILQVAKYETPNPLGHFFKKRSLEVKTEQLLDLILPEFDLIRELSMPGGGEGGAIGANLNPFKRKSDKPVVFWSGIKEVGPTERTLAYRVPDYFNGTLKVFAVAVSSQSLGVTSQSGFVRGQFVINPNVPTFVAPGDEFTVSTSVANNVDNSGENASVKVSLSVSENLELLDGGERTLQISEGREGSAEFRLRARTELGAAQLKFTAAHAKTSAKRAIELSVRPPIPLMTTLKSGSLKDTSEKVSIDRNLYPHHRTLTVSVSMLPLGLARGLVKYLNDYPYLCTEQLVSRAFPALVLNSRPEFGFAPEKVEDIRSQTLSILQARQNSDGAFGYWSASSNVEDLLQPHATLYLTEAKERGQTVPQELLDRSLQYLRGVAGQRGNRLSEYRLSAYAIYLLTRNGIVTTNYITALRKRMESETDWEKDITGAYLGASYRLLHLESESQSLIRQAKLGSKIESDYSGYHDSLSYDSRLLYLLAKHFPETLKSVEADQLRNIVEPLGRGDYNSLSSGYAVLALDAYSSTLGTSQLSGVSISETDGAGKTSALTLPLGMFPMVGFSPEAKTITVTSKSEYPVFYQVVQAGFDLSPPSEKLAEGLEVQREYRQNGAVVNEVSLGDKLEVVLKVRSTDNVQVPNIAVVDMLPGGFEVDMDSVRESEESPGMAFQATHREIREDRVLLFGSVSGDVKEFRYEIRATNRGTVSVPPIWVESMYDRKRKGLSLGGKVIVKARP